MVKMVIFGECTNATRILLKSLNCNCPTSLRLHCAFVLLFPFIMVLLPPLLLIIHHRLLAVVAKEIQDRENRQARQAAGQRRGGTHITHNPMMQPLLDDTDLDMDDDPDADDMDMFNTEYQ